MFSFVKYARLFSLLIVAFCSSTEQLLESQQVEGCDSWHVDAVDKNDYFQHSIKPRFVSPRRRIYFSGKQVYTDSVSIPDVRMHQPDW